MDILTLRRGLLALTGAVAGLSLWMLEDAALRGSLTERLHLPLSTFALVFFGAVLAMAGPLRLRRAAALAAPLAALVAVLIALVALRYEMPAAVRMQGLHWIAGFLIATLPLPYLTALGSTGGTAYPALFTASWQLAVRATAGLIFAGLVWAVIWLADAALGLVGLGFLDWVMIEGGPLPGMATGAMLGVGLAVAWELSDLLSPQVILRLLRLLVLPVLTVMILFLVALPMRGLSQLPGGVSATGVLLALAVAVAGLIAVVIDQSPEEESGSPVLQIAARVMAGLLPLPVALAGIALAERVGQHGWTPERVFAALAVLAAAGYGLAYLAAVLRGAGWAMRLRRANRALPPLVVLLAALWLTPLINAEAISARSQMARYDGGAVPAQDLDLAALERWGKSGQAALARLAELAAAPEHAALAQRLAARAAGGEAGALVMAEDAEALLSDLRAVMPLQPPGATATRDLLLRAIPAVELQSWIDACRTPLPGGDRAGCIFVVADLWTAEPGEEALVLLREPAGFVRYEGLGMVAGEVQRRSVGALTGMLPDRAEGEALIAALQDAPAALQPAPMNLLGVAGGLLLLP
ncbi:MAG: DUF4153 domain-containing protein [Rhodobacteraceae bacterium]|nr:DUF4153 domain-containing protein [Paracoccaceae bacterium]